MKIIQTVVLFTFCMFAANVARADTLVSDVSAVGSYTWQLSCSDWIGQSFLTGDDVDGYTLTSVTLGHLSTIGSSTMYLYSSEFIDARSNLASGGGLVASSTNLGSGSWIFNNITLTANTTYYIYLQIGGSSDYIALMYCSNSSVYADGTAYFSSYEYDSSTTPMGEVSNRDFAFSIYGTANVPEPATVAGIAGLAALGFAVMKRRKR